jgi:hypothetical protein
MCHSASELSPGALGHSMTHLGLATGSVAHCFAQACLSSMCVQDHDGLSDHDQCPGTVSHSAGLGTETQPEAEAGTVLDPTTSLSGPE